MKPILILLCFLGLYPGMTLSQPFTLGTSSEFPIASGVDGTLHLTKMRSHIRFKAGYVHSEFISSAASIINALNLYDTQSIYMMEKSFANGGQFYEVSIGYEQSTRKGLYLTGGYFYMLGGGSVTLTELAPKASIQITPFLFGAGDRPLQVESTIDGLAFHAGYRFPMRKNFGITTEVGLMKPLSSSTTMDTRILPGTIGSYTSIQFEDKLYNFVSQELIIPTGTVGINYAFQ
ncbi:MAG: hypothetical protein CMP10_15795 [Zetaproteobacteria bacterium]|nr:hypothetical protein [Pseudobdellovibrionaceae bacterium]|tara:strand:- start:445 stop:1143 length:699 start_codon:yes stop_codon:yes gene_type:complete